MAINTTLDPAEAERHQYAQDLANLGTELAELLAEMRNEARRQASIFIPSPLLPTIRASDLHGKPVPERRWLVDGLIPKGVPTNYSGDGGTGKSLTALQLVVSVVLGREWLGRETIQGRCLFVTAEDDIDETHRRLHAICHAEGISLAELDDLEICSLAGLDAVMGQSDNRSNRVSETELFKALRKKVIATEPVLVILDTLADLFSGDENNRMQARQFVGILRKLPTTVLLLSHPSVAGMQSGTGTSGSTAWSNSVRSRLYLSYPTTDDGEDQDNDLRVLTNKKQNYGKKGEEIILHWDNGRFVAEEEPDTETPYDIDDMVFSLCKKVFELGRTTTRSLIGTTLSDMEGARAIDGNKRRLKTKISQSIDRLVRDRKLVIVEKGPPAKRVNHVALP